MASCFGEPPPPPPITTLLSRGPYRPRQCAMPFFTKIQRFYPAANPVPTAGKTSHELARNQGIAEKMGKRQVLFTGKKVQEASRPDHDTTTPEERFGHERRHYNLLQNQGRPMRALLESHAVHSPYACPQDHPRPHVRLSAKPTQATSFQAKILLQSQFPPYTALEDAKERSNGPTSAAGPSHSEIQALIQEPVSITACVKRPASHLHRSHLLTVSDLMHRSGETPKSPIPHRTQLRRICSNTGRMSQRNLFECPLPTRRNALYMGCVDARNRKGIREPSDCIEPNGLFITPNARAKVRDPTRPLRHTTLRQPLQDKLDASLLPKPDARDDFLNARPTKAIHTLRRKCVDQQGGIDSIFGGLANYDDGRSPNAEKPRLSRQLLTCGSNKRHLGDKMMHRDALWSTVGTADGPEHPSTGDAQRRTSITAAFGHADSFFSVDSHYKPGKRLSVHRYRKSLI